MAGFSHISVRIKVTMKPTQQIIDRLGIGVGGRVQRYIDSECIRLMSAFTPKDKGALVDSPNKHTKLGQGLIEQGGSDAPYARRWYYEPANFQEAPKRGNKWFERMLNENKASILAGAKREAKCK